MSSGSTTKLKTWTSKYDGGTFTEISGIKYRNQRDTDLLRRLGKKQELKRRFGFLSLFGFSCTILATWETAICIFQQAFINGGPAGVAWGFPIVWICSTSVYMCLAEMASIAPIAGGQYFWVAILAPPRSKRFLSYVTGWLTTLAWAATLATGMVLVGTMIQGLVVLNNPGYELKSWQGTLFAWLIIVVAVIVNTLIAGLLPFLEGLILIVHLLGFVAVLIILVYLSPHVSASDVFFRPLNEGNWPTQALSFLVGFIGNVSTFAGADAAVHMSEEIDDAARNVPWAMFTSLILNGATGYGMILALLFSIFDIDSAINSPTGYAFIQIFADGTGVAAATAMTSLIIGLLWCAVIGFLATASRMMWSFARDRAMPFSHIIRKVDKRSSIPVYAIMILMVVTMLISLIRIGSDFAYTNVISMSVSALYISYLIPCSLLLWRRCTNQIAPHRTEDDLPPSPPITTTTNDSSSSPPPSTEQFDNINLSTGPKIIATPGMEDTDHVVDIPLMWGPWRIPGIFGVINNVLACVYCVFVLLWCFWPPEYPAAPDTMNYSVAATGGVFLFSIAYYYLHGKKNYKGPLIELTG